MAHALVFVLCLQALSYTGRVGKGVECRLVREQPVLDRLSGKELSHKAGTNLPFTTIFIFFSGIGQGRVTSNLQGAPIDSAVFVSDKEAVEMVKALFPFPRTYVTRVCTL